jgi:hypothetical protein
MALDVIKELTTNPDNQQKLADVLGTAIDNLYWGHVRGGEYELMGRNKNMAVFKVDEDGEEIERFALTREQFVGGVIKRAVERFLDDYDWPEADAALQYAVFGEVRYG